ncbi:Tyrosine-protein phosphatase CpsB [Candidatus Izimaplasma bacterium HR1]|jgi:protein-tyrosine phosphatase|uniref:tyrosine-protein phosphatase n=1 Tax=Candidatus Izimoplasma sp. HR1 TaxID=1541959 RepID=UPI0004F7C464|nr:Tyrosine-protein phosphatase CpsB [Candidatus Izimaplasma bacterium HR1]
MIDMHNHLLWDVDDGCKDIDESIKMIEEAVNSGVTDIFMTPHYRPTKGYIKTYEELSNKFTQLKQIITNLKMPINIYLGREIDEIDDLKVCFDNQNCTTLNNSHYVLVDFGARKADIEEFIYETNRLGYKTIIAHIERYKYLKTLSIFDSFKKQGALIQVNASSIISPRNKDINRKVKYLLKNKLVDFVASDSHGNPKSYQQMRKAYTYCLKKYGTEYANKIFIDNAKLLLKEV